MIISDTNLADYLDPALYDLENTDFEPDGPFFLSLARKIGGCVLESGCGTGRVTIPLAEQGVQITGLDIVPGMLAFARHKAGNLPIEWIEGDVRSFHLGRQYDLICGPGGVFEHMLDLTDQEAMLSRVREHLAPGGIFAIALRLPRPDMMVTQDDEQDWYAYSAADRGQVKVSGTYHYDPVRQITHETAIRRWIDGSGHEATKRAPLALRLIFPQEMETLLHYNSFQVIERYGDWNMDPLTEDSRQAIYLCQKA